MEKWFNGRIKE
jgi:hypothetical protein